MPNITFYTQMRADGGRRTGIEIDGDTAFGLFEPVDDEEFDPVLLWYVDIRCRGENLPADPDEARTWLLDQGGLLQSELTKLSKELAVGLDSDVLPLMRKVAGTPHGAEITMVCSCLRQTASKGFGAIVQSLAQDLEATLRSLPPAEAVA